MGESFAATSISKEKIEKLDHLLADFSVQAQPVWSLLVSGGGHLLVQRGFVYTFDVLSISALACGVFNSTMELARIIGESKFREFLQEGSRVSIYYTSVGDDYMLVTMFDDRTIPGVVKVASEEFSQHARKVLAR